MRSKLLASFHMTQLPRAVVYLLGVVGCYLAVGFALRFLDADAPLVVAHAQQDQADADPEATATLAALQRRGSVVFRDTPLAEVILILSEQWKVNIVAGASIDGSISGTFRHEKLEKILDSLLTANGFSYRQIGSSLVIVNSDQASVNRPNFKVEVIDIPIENAEELSELTDALKMQMSPEGQLQPIKASGKFAISDTAENIEAVKRLLAQIGGSQPTRFTAAPGLTDAGLTDAGLTDAGLTDAGLIASRAQQLDPNSGALELRPQFIMAKDLQEPLTTLLGAGTVAVLEQENIVVVFGDPVIQHRARLLLQQLDRPRAQVRITGYIYDVDLGEIERLGVDWNTQMMSQSIDANGIPRNLGLSQSGMLVPNAPNNAAGIASGAAQAATAAAGGGATGGAAAATTAATANGGQFLFRTLNSNFELQALIQALDQTDGSRLLADPHVTVVDRHTASLGIVTEIPIQQLTETQQGGAIGTTTFREAGITLEVTPRIASDGTIEMEVSPEFSVLAGFQNGNPIIDTRRATTTVRVVHGQALVIGGLRSKSTVETIKGIPGLMHARFIGKLFRTHATEVRESELIVLIMPEIVGYCGGLEREMHALDVAQQQLSRISTAVDGPICANCNDKYCPHHYERPRIHNGMQDNGLIGGYDTIFVSPVAPAMLFPNVPFPNAQPAMEESIHKALPLELSRGPATDPNATTPHPPTSTPALIYAGYAKPAQTSTPPTAPPLAQPTNNAFTQVVPPPRTTATPQPSRPQPSSPQPSSTTIPEVPSSSIFRTVAFPENRR